MDDDIIEELADAFAEQLRKVQEDPAWRRYEAAVLDDIILVAGVIHRNQPTYDLRYYYKRAGYPEPYPVHEM